MPVGARFSAPVQTGSGAHPASYTIGTGYFLGIKQLRHGTDHPPTSSAEVKERVVIPLVPFWTFVACSRGELYIQNLIHCSISVEK
jgi:hypothetical protein